MMRRPLPPAERAAGPVVVSGVSSDAHTWNLVFLHLLIEECGHAVRNLGPCVPPDLLVSACLDAVPSLIVLSSVNGHGHRDGLDSIRAVRAEPRLAGVPVVIGGKLDVTGELAPERTRRLLDAGADAVCTDDTGVHRLRAILASRPAHTPLAA